MAGLFLGGGLGCNDHEWGTTCDRLAETRMVWADGSLVRASAEENTDLFWACRGGAAGNIAGNAMSSCASASRRTVTAAAPSCGYWGSAWVTKTPRAALPARWCV